MNLKRIMLSERSQTQMLRHIWLHLHEILQKLVMKSKSVGARDREITCKGKSFPLLG